jgi:hypothetical protein
MQTKGQTHVEPVPASLDPAPLAAMGAVASFQAHYE